MLMMMQHGFLLANLSSCGSTLVHTTSTKTKQKLPNKLHRSTAPLASQTTIPHEKYFGGFHQWQIPRIIFCLLSLSLASTTKLNVPHNTPEPDCSSTALQVAQSGYLASHFSRPAQCLRWRSCTVYVRNLLHICIHKAAVATASVAQIKNCLNKICSRSTRPLWRDDLLSWARQELNQSSSRPYRIVVCRGWRKFRPEARCTSSG